MNPDPEVLAWREKTNTLIHSLNTFVENGKLDNDQIAEAIKQSAGATLRRERFYNTWEGTEFENTFSTLHQYIQIAMNYEGAMAMIPIQAALLQGGQLSMNEFVEYLHDGILLTRGLSENKIADESEEDDLNKEADAFNALLDQVEEAAENEDYVDAIIFLDEAFELAEKNVLLMYDRINMLNNRAFYNYQLGNYDEGLKDCLQAISEDPECGVIYHTEAEIYFAMENYTAALRSIDMAIDKENTKDKQQFKKTILSKF